MSDIFTSDCAPGDRISRLPEDVQRFMRENMHYEPTPPCPHSRNSVVKEWIYHESKLPWLKLPIQVPASEMLAEAQNILNRFVTHRSRDSKGWKSICLRGLSMEQTLGPKPYGYANDREAPYRWTELAKVCPITTGFFQQRFPCRTMFRIRFMLLEPDGYIEPHQDRKNHYLSGINIALNNPRDCVFKMRRAGTIPIAAGDALLLDTANEHSIVNLSDETRIHLIVHPADATAQWDRMLCDAYFQHIEHYPVATFANESETDGPMLA